MRFTGRSDQAGCGELIECALDGGQPDGAAPSPVDRRKQGLKRSIATEAGGIPLAAVPAPTNHRDDWLLAATLDAIGVIGPLPERPVVHLDATATSPAGRCWSSGNCWPTSPRAASPRQCRLAAGE